MKKHDPSMIERKANADDQASVWFEKTSEAMSSDEPNSSENHSLSTTNSMYKTSQ